MNLGWSVTMGEAISDAAAVVVAEEVIVPKEVAGAGVRGRATAERAAARMVSEVERDSIYRYKLGAK